MQSAFVSEETFTQEGFREFLGHLPTSDLHHYELVRGRIVMTPPAGWGHSALAGALYLRLAALVARAGRKRGRVFESSVGYELPSGDTLEPDVSWVSAERWAAAPQPPSPQAFLRAVPDLVIEVLSPSTAHRDRTEKAEIYAENGVEEYWLVDPHRRCVVVFAREVMGFGPGRTWQRGRIVSRVLPDLVIEAEELFAELD